MEEEIVINPSPPNEILNKLKYRRFANIFFNLSMTTIGLSFFAFLSTLITPLLFVGAIAILFFVVIIMIVFTLGAVFAIESKPVAKVWGVLSSLINSGDAVGNITVFCFNVTKWISVAGIATSIISLIFMSLSKCKGKVAKIVLLCVSLVISGVILALHLLTGGIPWQN